CSKEEFMTKLMITKPRSFLSNPLTNPRFPTLFPHDIFEELDKFFSDTLNYHDSSYTLNKGFPKGGVFVDKNGNTVVELALAGYSKESLSVRIEDNQLVISGNKQDGEEDDGIMARRAFTRRFPNFNNNWDLKASEVTYKDGLLRVVVPPMSHKPDTTQELEIK